VTRRSTDPLLRQRQAYAERDVDYLVRALRTDGAYRSQAARYLRKLGAREAIPDLIRALNANDPATRCAVVRALGSLGATEAAARLADLARSDPHHAVRGWAIRSLGELRALDQIELMRSFLADEDPRTRACGAIALGVLGEPMFIPEIEGAAKREPWSRRGPDRKAIRALKRVR
jgi:HEAT repeat protein